MRDHRDGQDPTPVDITAQVREHTGKGVLRPLTTRELERRKARVGRQAAAATANRRRAGKAGKILRGQR